MASIISAGTTSGTALNMAGDTSGVLQLATNGSTTAVTVDASQNVGIGTASPTQALTVNGRLAFSNLFAASNIDGIFLQSGIGTTVNTATGNNITFNTGTTERMRITSDGNLGVGTTTPGGTKISALSSTTTGACFSANSPASFVTGNYTSNSVTAAGTGWFHFYAVSSNNTIVNIIIYGNGNIQNANNSYGALSDIKLKENIVDASPKLDKLMQVKVRNYNLKGNYEQHKQIGVIAQELEQIFPSMIDETPDKDSEGNELGTTTKSVKYSVFVPMLIKAMQEQQTIINDLKARITALEGAA